MYLHKDFIDAIRLMDTTRNMFSSAHPGAVVQLLEALNKLAKTGHKLELQDDPIRNDIYLVISLGDYHKQLRPSRPYDDNSVFMLTRAVNDSCLLQYTT